MRHSVLTSIIHGMDSCPPIATVDLVPYFDMEYLPHIEKSPYTLG